MRTVFIAWHCLGKRFHENIYCRYTLQIYAVCKSRIEISHTLMEISLNIMGFTDFCYKEMLISLISFSSRNTFSLNLLKWALFRQKLSWVFLIFSLSSAYRFRDISKPSELKFTTEDFWASTWLIDFDGLCNYLHPFQKQLAVSLFKNNNCCFPDQGYVGHYTNKFTETGFDFFIKYLLRAI